jgi:hypothetical protein
VIDVRVVERQRDARARGGAVREVCVREVGQLAFVDRGKHGLELGPAHRAPWIVGVELDHFTTLARAIEPCFDAVDVVACVRVDVDRAVDAALIPRVERTWCLGGVVLARGQAKERTCYGDDVHRLSFAPLLACTVAHADVPNDLVARPIVLARGQLTAELVADINLAPGRVGDSVSLAPDVWYGALPELTIGLVHSSPSVDRFSPGATICIEQQTNACSSTYRGSGLDARYSARAGELAVAPRLRLLVRDIDPVKPAITLGSLVRWTRGRFAIIGDPYVMVGLANTDQGNRHALFLPVTFAVQPTARWELALRTGFHSDLAVIRDGWHVPVVLATRVALDAHFELGMMLGFETLLGPQNTAKQRALFFTFAYRS